MLQKIFIIYTSCWYKDTAEDALNKAYRERFIAECLKSMGYEASLLLLSHEKNIYKENTGVETIVFPVDDPSESNPGRHTSKPLIEHIESREPGMILLSATVVKFRNSAE